MRRALSSTPLFPVVLALTALLAAAPATLRAQDVGLPLGSTPDAVVVEDLEGKDVALSSWVGKRPVVIEFWAHWCEQCEALMPRLEAVAKQYAGQLDVLIVAVGVNQTRRSVARHTARHALPGSVLYDAAGRAVRAYRAPATSYIVVLDARGRVVYTGVGPEQDFAAAAARAVRDAS